MNMISIMGPGEAVVSRPGLDMPIFAKISKVPDLNEPFSRNVKLFGNNGIFDEKPIE